MTYFLKSNKVSQLQNYQLFSLIIIFSVQNLSFIYLILFFYLWKLNSYYLHKNTTFKIISDSAQLHVLCKKETIYLRMYFSMIIIKVKYIMNHDKTNHMHYIYLMRKQHVEIVKKYEITARRDSEKIWENST